MGSTRASRCWRSPQAEANLWIKFVATLVPGHRGVTEAEAQAWAADLTGLGRDVELLRGRPYYPHIPLQVPSMPKRSATTPL